MDPQPVTPIEQQGPRFPLLPTFLVLLLSISTGFLGYQNWQQRKELASLRTLPTPISTTPPTTNWKTYTNVSYKITFEYPSNIEIEINQVDSRNYIEFIFDKNSPNPFTIKASIKYPANQTKYLIDTGPYGSRKIADNVWDTYSLSLDEGLQLEKNNVLYSVIYPPSRETIVNQILSTFQFLEQSQTTNTSAWKTYETRDYDVKVTFQVPQSWLNTYGNFVEQSFAGQSGLQFCLTITKKSLMEKIRKPVYAGGVPCSIEWFGFGGLSKDYEAGRGGGFSDTNGFTVENGRYYYLMNLDRKIDISTYVIDSYVNPYGIQFLIVNGANYPSGEMAGGPVSGTPGSNTWGALVNVPTGRIAGLAIEMKKTLGDETLLKQILSTFQFTAN